MTCMYKTTFSQVPHFCGSCQTWWNDWMQCALSICNSLCGCLRIYVLYNINIGRCAWHFHSRSYGNKTHRYALTSSCRKLIHFSHLWLAWFLLDSACVTESSCGWRKMAWQCCMCLIEFVACWRDDTCAVHATMKVKCVLQSFHSVSSLMLVGSVSATEPSTHHIQLERENPVRVSKLQGDNLHFHSSVQQGFKNTTPFDHATDPTDLNFWFQENPVLPSQPICSGSFQNHRCRCQGKRLHDGRGWHRGCLLQDSDGTSCLGLFFMAPFAKHQDYAAETNIPDILHDI